MTIRGSASIRLTYRDHTSKSRVGAKLKVTSKLGETLWIASWNLAGAETIRKRLKRRLGFRDQLLLPATH